MKKFPVVIALLLAFVSIPAVVRAQEIKYQKAPAELNRRAEDILRKLLAATDADPAVFDDALVCGTTLWADLKKTAPLTPESGKALLVMIQGPKPARAEGRRMLEPGEKIAFWDAFRKKYGASPKAIRAANDIEINYFWATIPFDIVEPLVTLDFGDRQVIVNFTLKSGAPKIFWMDTVADLTTLVGYKTRTPFGGVNRSEAAPTVPIERTDATTPKDWRAYDFDFTQKYKVGFILPGDPGPGTDEPLSIKLDKILKLKSRTFVVTVMPAGSFFIGCANEPSIPLSGLTEAQKMMLAKEIAGVSIRGIQKALTQAGREEAPVTYAEPQVVKVGDRTAYEQKVGILSFTIRVRVMIAGENLFFASALSSPQAEAADVEAFFERFTIRER